MRTCLILVFLSSFFALDAQNAIRQFEAKRVTEAPVIDGAFDDGAWQSAMMISDFVETQPDPGGSAAQATEIRMVYDDEAVYVAAYMKDTEADKILQPLSERDDMGNADWFGFFIDAYNAGNNGFGFFVTAAGVQVDIKYTEDGESNSWDAVWESAVQVDASGWRAEYKIPYSALRFPESAVQDWRVNFARDLRRTRERSYWNYIDPEIDGFINQWGQVKGIENIEAPIRLALIPYVSTNVSSSTGGGAAASTSYGYSGGMDVKYGINDAFTLDMTLIPDFGQVKSDDQVLNLSPFETFFEENRQFFTEGIELFDRGNWFYTRRIGGRPHNFFQAFSEVDSNEVLISNPTKAQLLNATKLSGRTKGKLGIGVFNAVVGESFAEIQDTSSEGNGAIRKVQTNPLTNYNVLVFDQALKNNSSIALVNTNVLRADGAKDANLTGFDGYLKNEKQTFGFEFSGALSQEYFKESDNVLGYTSFVQFRKIKGNFTYGIYNGIESDTYNPNDAGFLFANNSVTNGVFANYNIYKPTGPFNGIYTNYGLSYERLYNPFEFSGFNMNAGFTGILKSFHSFGVYTNLSPAGSHDYFEPRNPGYFYKDDARYNFGGWISSDYRRTFALDINTNFNTWSGEGRQSIYYRISPRLRVSDKLMLIYIYAHDNIFNYYGFADIDAASGQSVFGRRYQKSYTNILDAAYIFNPTMSLKFRARHNWSNVEYDALYLLEQDGGLTFLENNQAPEQYNNNFNAFNIDLIYTWQFAPGSELIVSYKNNILSAHGGDDLPLAFIDNFDSMLQERQNNILSVKALYYLDYLQLRKLSKKYRS